MTVATFLCQSLSITNRIFGTRIDAGMKTRSISHSLPTTFRLKAEHRCRCTVTGLQLWLMLFLEILGLSLWIFRLAWAQPGSFVIQPTSSQSCTSAEWVPSRPMTLMLWLVFPKQLRMQVSPTGQSRPQTTATTTVAQMKQVFFVMATSRTMASFS